MKSQAQAFQIVEKLGIERLKTYSGAVVPGDLFAALPGADTHGARYVQDAIARGARFILSDQAPPPGLPAHVFWVVVSDVKAEFARLAHAALDFPTRDMSLVGVTGTNGKSTVAHGLAFLFNRLGRRFGLFGTVEYRFLDRSWETTHTTPDLVTFLSVLRDMKALGAEGAVLEVSSHALHQERLSGSQFQAAVFTNLTQDHLDYHRTMDAYFDAKARLFSPQWMRPDGFAAVNADDPYGRKLAQAGFPQRVFSYGCVNPQAHVFAKGYRSTLEGIEAEIRTPRGERRFKSPLIGVHNLSNLLAMIAIALGFDFDLDRALSALAGYTGLRGRLERVTPEGHPFSVFVDYAHTPDALHWVLRSLKPLVQAPGRLWALFGCGGNRDRLKRPLMGREAALWADRLCVTSDNPRDEDPEAIIAEIRAGIPEDALERTVIETDRARAIRACVGRLKAGDILLVAGKGHETYQVVGKERIFFDDAEAVQQCLK